MFAIVPFGGPEVLATYPELTHAAEMPVVDTACAALLALARRVRHDGYKVALTGEGSDEFLAGYPWFKVQKLVNALDAVRSRMKTDATTKENVYSDLREELSKVDPSLVAGL